ncbi:MAG: hypothetical protein RXQ00_09495 [Caldivirga sp.]|jgi:hypothetical protein
MVKPRPARAERGHLISSLTSMKTYKVPRLFNAVKAMDTLMAL